MGVPADWLQGAVRFSLSRFNQGSEVRYVNEKLPPIVQRLRARSTLGRMSTQTQPGARPASQRKAGTRG
jgi:hypothetical protein